jgi:hypothetical protein
MPNLPIIKKAQLSVSTATVNCVNSPYETVNTTQNTVENNVATMPGRNGGQLLAGGKPGNRGGTGRPRSEVRALARTVMIEALEQLIERVEKRSLHGHELIRAAELGGRYGLGEVAVEVTDASWIEAAVQVLAKELGMHEADRLLRLIAERVEDSA